MSRRSVAVMITCVFLGFGLLATVLAGLLRYQPHWYKGAAPPSGAERRKHAEDFLSVVSDLVNGLQNEREWGVPFADVQINSYLEEGFRQDLPQGISEPRVAFDTERIRLGFRYGSGLLSTVITI